LPFLLLMYLFLSKLRGVHYSATKLVKKSHILKFINDFFLLLGGNELSLQGSGKGCPAIGRPGTGGVPSLAGAVPLPLVSRSGGTTAASCGLFLIPQNQRRCN